MYSAYDHDHGSSPYHIFGYHPKYNYVAFKNSREDESHTGFKGIVYRKGGYFVYYSLHVRTSSLRRVSVRRHTIQLVIASAKTKEILVNIQHKGDFGWQSVRMKKFSQFRPLKSIDFKIQKEQKDAGDPRFFRSIPVLDDDGGTFGSRNPAVLGQYEEWQTLPICSRQKNPSRPNDVVRVSLKEPITGIKKYEQPDSKVNLGDCIKRLLPKGKTCDDRQRDAFVHSVNLNRFLDMLNVEVSDKHCPGGKNGVFYTDPLGEKLFDGPGKNRLRQYIKKGFSVVLEGRFEPSETWVGLYSDASRGHFLDHDYGIDPKLN